MQPRWPTLIVLSCLACFVPRLPADTIVTFGDSTTAPRNVGAANNGRPAGDSTYGLNQADAANPPHNRVIGVDETSSQLYVYSDMLRDLLTTSPFVLDAVDNEGIGGNRTDQAVNRLNADVLAKSPQTVVVQFGINDSAHDGGPGTASRIALDFDVQTGGDGVLGNGNDHPFASRGNYRNNLTQVVQTLQLESINVILMTPNQVIDYNVVTNAQLGFYAQVVRDVAESEETLLVDVWAMYEQFSSTGGNIGSLLLDGVHPNGDGHQLVADALFGLIDESGPPNGIVGDVNQDGLVAGDGTQSAAVDDVTAFVDGWLTGGHVNAWEMYTHGDLNFDGRTDFGDAFILHTELLGAGGVGLDFSLLRAVPGPLSFWMLPLAALLVSPIRAKARDADLVVSSR